MAQQKRIELPDIPLGTMVRGWQILHVIGKGGMAAVYAVERPEEHIRRAMKVTSSWYYYHPMNPLHEANIMASYWKHPHPRGLPEVHSAWMQDGKAYIVMDFLEGEDLVDHCKPLFNSRLTRTIVDEIVLMLCGMLRILRYLHTLPRPVMHMDVKPENFIRHRGELSLFDFGLSYREGDPYWEVGDGRILGTLDYIDPLQALEYEPDCRSDIFAVGLIGYELLTGQRPRKHWAHPVPKIFPYSLQYPRFLARAINRATEFRMEDRFQSAQEFLDALHKC
jgi:serine/threonine-protein kinase